MRTGICVVAGQKSLRELDSWVEYFKKKGIPTFIVRISGRFELWREQIEADMKEPQMKIQQVPRGAKIIDMEGV